MRCMYPGGPDHCYSDKALHFALREPAAVGECMSGLRSGRQVWVFLDIEEAWRGDCHLATSANHCLCTRENLSTRYLFVVELRNCKNMAGGYLPEDVKAIVARENGRRQGEANARGAEVVQFEQCLCCPSGK